MYQALQKNKNLEKQNSFEQIITAFSYISTFAADSLTLSKVSPKRAMTKLSKMIRDMIVFKSQRIEMKISSGCLKLPTSHCPRAYQ